MAEEIPRYPGIQMPRNPGWKRRHPVTQIFSREDTQVSMCEETQDGRRVNVPDDEIQTCLNTGIIRIYPYFFKRQC